MSGIIDGSPRSVTVMVGRVWIHPAVTNQIQAQPAFKSNNALITVIILLRVTVGQRDSDWFLFLVSPSSCWLRCEVTSLVESTTRSPAPLIHSTTHHRTSSRGCCCSEFNVSLKDSLTWGLSRAGDGPSDWSTQPSPSSSIPRFGFDLHVKQVQSGQLDFISWCSPRWGQRWIEPKSRSTFFTP